MTDKIIPAALRIWLVFLLLLLLLGYSVLTCIFFGAIAGFAGGMVSAWWNTKGGEPKPTPLPEPIRKFSRKIKETTPTNIPLGRVFGRRDRRYSRPKR